MSANHCVLEEAAGVEEEDFLHPAPRQQTSRTSPRQNLISRQWRITCFEKLRKFLRFGNPVRIGVSARFGFVPRPPTGMLPDSSFRNLPDSGWARGKLQPWASSTK